MSEGNDELPGMPKPTVPANMSPEFLQAIMEAAAKAGLALPAQDFGAPHVPTFALEWGWRRLAISVGAAVRKKDIFLRSNELGTIDRTTGRWIRFDQRSFVGWLEEFVAFTWKGDKTVLIGEHGAMIMSQLPFRDQIRVVESINLISVPVTRLDGSTEWLAPGYDEATKTFTVETIKYEHDWALERAKEWFRKHCEGFPWMRGDHEVATSYPDGRTVPPPLEMNRSYAVHIGAMLGVYCATMFAPGSLRPMICYGANQAGSGKSVLVQMAIAPVHGLVASNKLPRNDDELSKEFDSAAQAFAPFLFLDDVGHFLHSAPMNRFVTSSRHAGRVLQSKERFDVPAVTQVFVTGNNIKGSRDLARRSLIVELFFAGELKERPPFELEITGPYLAREEVRKGFLSALCALVKHWATATPEERAVLAKLPALASFEDWTRLVASVLIFAGFTNPLSAPLVPFDVDDDQMKDLLVAAATGAEAAKSFTRDELITLAREKELLEEIVGTKGGKELDSKANIKFGRRLQAWRGRELVDENGRRFRFGHKKQKTGATYPLEFL